MAKEVYERLRYVGPVSSFSVVTPAKGDGAPVSKDRALITGVTYDDLPGDHPVIAQLMVARLLVPAGPAEPAMAESGNSKTGDDRSSSRSSKGGSK